MVATTCQAISGFHHAETGELTGEVWTGFFQLTRKQRFCKLIELHVARSGLIDAIDNIRGNNSQPPIAQVQSRIMDSIPAEFTLHQEQKCIETLGQPHDSEVFREVGVGGVQRIAAAGGVMFAAMGEASSCSSYSRPRCTPGAPIPCPADCAT
jgi:hypothetical protein